jgi:hypothetical protein
MQPDMILDQATKQTACLEYCPKKGRCEYYAFEQDKCPKIQLIPVILAGVMLGKIKLP